MTEKRILINGDVIDSYDEQALRFTRNSHSKQQIILHFNMRFYRSLKNRHIDIIRTLTKTLNQLIFFANNIQRDEDIKHKS